MNKRDFKKYVEALGSSVANEMMIAYYNVEGVDRDAVGAAIQTVIAAVAEAKNNANRFFDRGAKSFADHQEYAKAKSEFFRALFAKIEKDFNGHINDALKSFNAALPEEVKKAQKEAVN